MQFHFEVWLDSDEDVWSTLLNRADTEEEILFHYRNACNEYGEENVEVVKIDENDNIYPVEFL